MPENIQDVEIKEIGIVLKPSIRLSAVIKFLMKNKL